VIIEVAIGEETPRRYQLRRDGHKIVARRLDNETGNGAEGIDTVIDWRRPQHGIYSLLIDDRSFEVFVEPNEGNLTVHLRSRSYRVQAHDVRRHRAAVVGDAAADGTVRITAPIPGRVTRVLVSPGQ